MGLMYGKPPPIEIYYCRERTLIKSNHILDYYENPSPWTQTKRQFLLKEVKVLRSSDNQRYAPTNLSKQPVQKVSGTCIPQFIAPHPIIVHYPSHAQRLGKFDQWDKEPKVKKILLLFSPTHPIYKEIPPLIQSPSLMKH